MKKKISIVLMICMSLLLLSSCKSKSEIKRQVSGLVNFYDATPIMEKFEDTEKKYVTLSSTRSIQDGESYYSKSMFLQYDSKEKCFYGKYEVNKKLWGSEVDDSSSKETYYVKLDEEGYHPQKGKNFPDEVKKFKYMFEIVNLNGGYLDELKVAKTVYNFELPEYIVDYELVKPNKEINEYLNSADLLTYGTGYLMSFMVDDFGTNEFTFFISKEKYKGAVINESIAYPSEYSNYYNNKKKYYEVNE